MRFEDVTLAAGLTSTFTQGNSHTGGCAWVDYNGDLLPDLFLTNGGGRPHHLYRNEGGGLFTDVSSLVPKPDLALEDAGVCYADIENDGDYDILVYVDNPATLIVNQPVNPPDGGPNLLYVNQGDGTFVEAAATLGVVHPSGRRTSCAGFADYDNDGFVDLYLGSWTVYGLPLGVHDDFDRLLHNRGDGSFEDVTAQFGADGNGLDALTLLWLDADFDRYPDLYVGNTAFVQSPPAFDARDIYYRNLAGTAFVDDAPNLAGIGNDALAAMGMDAGDVDNDGDWDLYITDTYSPVPQGNVFYPGSPDGSFSENEARARGIDAFDSWPCGFVDLDRDKWVDLWVGSLVVGEQDHVFVNRGDGTFLDIVPSGFVPARCRGGAWADYDGDGDVDLFAVNDAALSRLYRNDSPVRGGWVEFKLLGVQSNRGAVGALVQLESGGTRQMRRVSGGDSAHSHSDAILHFGTGFDESLQVTVRWPSGVDQTFPALEPDRLYLIDEVDGIVEETLSGSCSYDPERMELEFHITSNYLGRAKLTAEGFGPLRYDAGTRAHRGRFACPRGVPARVAVRSELGGEWSTGVRELGEAPCSGSEVRPPTPARTAGSSPPRPRW